MINYYEILRCSIDASYDQLKSNYKKLILQHHPDKSGESNSDHFQLVQKAWDVLGDSQKRQQFDEEFKLFYSSPKNVILYDTLKVEELAQDSDGDFFLCRCGGCYSLTKDLKNLLHSLHAVYIPCPFCSLTLKVVEYCMDELDSELKPRSQFFEESFNDETNLFEEEKQIFIEKGMNSLYRVILTL